MKETDISVTIEFDEKTFKRQKGYNEDYAKGVNKVISDFKAQVPDLTDEDVAMFLSQPEALAKKLEQEAWEEYEAYTNSLPKSVKASMNFQCEKGDIVRRLHKQLPEPRTYFLTINTCKMDKNGVCVFDEEALKDRCTIKGSPNVLRLWQKAQEACASLNSLQKALREISPNFMAVEDLPTFYGLIRDEGFSYATCVDRIEQLAFTESRKKM